MKARTSVSAASPRIAARARLAPACGTVSTAASGRIARISPTRRSASSGGRPLTATMAAAPRPSRSSAAKHGPLTAIGRLVTTAALSRQCGTATAESPPFMLESYPRSTPAAWPEHEGLARRRAWSRRSCCSGRVSAHGRVAVRPTSWWRGVFPEGNYVFRAQLDGYNDFISDPVRVQAGRSISVPLHLTIKAKAAAPEPKAPAPTSYCAGWNGGEEDKVSCLFKTPEEDSLILQGYWSGNDHI